MPNAVITGATQGIGKAIAERFLAEGFSVAICARTAADLDNLSAEWNKRFPGATIITQVADLSKKNDATAFAQAVLNRFNSIDVLVNNAGIYMPGLLATEPDGQLEKLMAINMYSSYYITRALLPKMKELQAGHIFNMCSVASHRAYPNGGAYSITKYAMLGFSENLRLELRTDNIKVTSISPGATESRSWEGANIPAGRMMQATDVADMIWAAYTLSKQATVEHITMRPQLGDL